MATVLSVERLSLELHESTLLSAFNKRRESVLNICLNADKNLSYTHYIKRGLTDTETIIMP